MDKSLSFAIKIPAQPDDQPCVICGEMKRPNLHVITTSEGDLLGGPTVYLDGTWDLVCNECAEREAPQLYDVILVWLHGVTRLMAEAEDSAARLRLIPSNPRAYGFQAETIGDATLYTSEDMDPWLADLLRDALEDDDETPAGQR